MRLRPTSTSNTLTLTMSPDFHHLASILDEGPRHGRYLHQAVVMPGDVDEAPDRCLEYTMPK
jgi:hypothetical protein